MTQCCYCPRQSVRIRDVSDVAIEMPRVAPKSVINQIKMYKQRTVLLTFKGAKKAGRSRGLDLIFPDAKYVDVDVDVDACCPDLHP